MKKPLACLLALLLALTGAAIYLAGWLRDDHLPLLSTLVIKVALPCMIFNNILGQYTPESLAELALGDLGCETLGRSPVRFVCDCSRGRMESALLALGREELTELLSTDGGAELSCHFCNRKYRFSADELKALISRCGG